jgi:hypothetical protein
LIWLHTPRKLGGKTFTNLEPWTEIYSKVSIVSVGLLATLNAEEIMAAMDVAAIFGRRIVWTEWTAEDVPMDYRNAVFKYVMASAAADIVEELHLPYWCGETDVLPKLYSEFAHKRLSFLFFHTRRPAKRSEGGSEIACDSTKLHCTLHQMAPTTRVLCRRE